MCYLIVLSSLIVITDDYAGLNSYLIVGNVSDFL